jgi:hypothetical protein
MPTTITESQLARLHTWGHVGSEAAAIDSFHAYYEEHLDDLCRSTYGRSLTRDGEAGRVTRALIDSRDCDYPDKPRDANGQRVEEARWPDQCAELVFTKNFEALPGMDIRHTTAAFKLAIYILNTAWEASTTDYAEHLGTLGVVGIPILPVGTIAHEILHAYGCPHNRTDPDSLMWPSMRGQYVPNVTDRRNFAARGYNALSWVTASLGDWSGRAGSHIWATLGALGGGTLARSGLANGSCSQKIEQRYDSSGRNWSSGRQIVAKRPSPPPEPPGPTPPPPGTRHVRFHNDIAKGIYELRPVNPDPDPFWPS